MTFLLRRMRSALFTIGCVMLMLFALVRSVPGDIASIMLGPRATPELRQQLVAEMGLDQSIFVQLWLFLSRVVRGDFGEDVISRRPILDIVIEVLPNTLILAATALLLSLVFGILLGLVAAKSRGSWADSLLGLLSVAFVSTPSLVVSIVLLLVFSRLLNWFPVAGVGERGDVLNQLAHLVLPATALALGWTGYIARLVRAALLETLTEHHIRTLRAYGVPEWRIAGIFAMRLALVPLVAILGIGLGDLIGSAVFAELIFARPGIGSLIFNAIAVRNYPVVQAAVLVIVIIYILANLAVDLINSRLDPRIARSLRSGRQS